MKRILFIILLTLVFSPISALKIYNKKDKKVDMDISVSTKYDYKASLFPGLSSFHEPKAKLKLTGEYLDNLKLFIYTDLNDEGVKAAYINYDFFKPLGLRVGKFKVHYGREKTESTAASIDSDASDNFTPGYSSGISLYGKDLLNIIDYNLSFTNDYNSNSENETGQHTLTLFFGKTFILGQQYELSPGYNVLYNTDETFSQSISIMLYPKENIGSSILLEYMEQRYFNYYWNHSALLSSSYRFENMEPFVQFEYYDEYVGEKVDKDSFNSGIGVNIYSIDEHLKIKACYINRYGFSKVQTGGSIFISRMDHKFSLELEFSL